MKNLLISLILGLGTASAFSATMPSANDCTTITASGSGYGYQRQIHNNCAYQIQVELMGQNGDREMMFVSGYSQNSTGTGGIGDLHTYACPTPSHPSAASNYPVPVSYETDTYWCVR